MIDASDEVLERARALLGTRTNKDTVNAALEQVVALDARRQLLDDTSALSRLDRPAADVALSPLIEAGQVATCGMVELEPQHYRIC